MRGFGTLLLISGIILGIYTFSMETSVPVDGNSLFSTNRISNLSLMDQRQSLLIVSGILSLMGSIFIGSDHIAETVKNSTKSQQKTESPADSK